MATSVRLIAATPDMQGLLMKALEEHGVACRSEGKIVIVESESGSAADSGVAFLHIVALLREALSGPQRESVSVVEDLEFPHEFPVTTRFEAWSAALETSR